MAHAPAVSNGKYSFALDCFYVESSGHQVHRRATVPEIQALFQPGGPTADPTGHWYEAQLLHYGLPPSKTKAVAKTRLLDAVNSGNLAVPKDILKIETDLKKAWRKKDKDHRADRAKQDQPPVPDSSSKKKRAAADDAHDDGQKPAAQAKKAKSSETSSKKPTVKASPATETTDAPAPKPRTKLTARCSRGAIHSSSRPAAIKNEGSEPPKKKQTARRGGAMNIPSTTVADTTESSQPPRKKQTARCSRGAIHSSSRTTATKTESPEPPKKKQTARRGGSKQTAPRGGGTSRGRQPDADDVSPADSPRLGLINGYYEIESRSLNQWETFPEEDFSLTLCLSGNSIWGEYDFGMYHGILYMPKRPWTASEDEIPFQWRGTDRSEGEIRFGDSNEGFIRFLGGGQIEGEINCYGRAKFSGWRTSDDDTSPLRSVASMRREWDGYNQDEYERLRVARWH